MQDTSSESIGTSEVELHKKLALELLEKSPVYLTALKAEAIHEKMSFDDATSIVEHFSRCQAEAVDDLFILTRQALETVGFSSLNESEKKGIFDAVTALYMLAAMRLVNAASRQNGHIVFVPRSEHIFCAIIATALFGGSLKILPEYDATFPKLEYVFEVYTPAAGNYIAESFERALYVSVYQNNRKVDLSTLDSNKLSLDEICDLRQRLKSIRKVKKQNLCVVVTAGVSADSAALVSNEYQVPTLFQSDDAANIVLGMTHNDFTSHIKEFWQQLVELSNKHPFKSTSAGGKPMQGDQFNINAQQVNLAITKAENSVAQAGEGHSATFNQQKGLELKELTKLINDEIFAAINAHPSEKSRNALKSHLETAQQELEKPKPDKNLLENALEKVKELGEAIDGGEKIVELCGKALPYLAALTVF